MRYIGLFAALLAACVFIVPALSMQEDGFALKECAKQMNSPCYKSLMSEETPDLQQQGRPNAMADNKERDFAPKSMMDGREDPFGEDPCSQNRRMNRNRDDAPESMMEGKQPNPFCEKPQAGQDVRTDPKSMMNSKECPSGWNSQNPQMDKDEKTHPRSMMDGKQNSCGQDQRMPQMGQNMGSIKDIAAPK